MSNQIIAVFGRRTQVVTASEGWFLPHSQNNLVVSFHSSSNPRYLVTILFTMNTALVDVRITSVISSSE